MTVDLVQFLRDRLNEDQQVALAAGRVTGGGNPDAESTIHTHSDDEEAVAEHIARHDPARVLAEVDAKRRLVADVLAERHFRNEEDHWYSCAALTDEQGEPLCFDEGRAPGPCDCGRDERATRRLRLLALPYADHPDYRQEWRP